jgi:ubiquitin-protein ligase
MPSSSSISARHRLQRDAKELFANPIPNVSAVPIKDDLQHWSVNMVGGSGDLAGVPIHLHARYGSDYPTAPPDVRMKSELKHPNVYGDWICLDMIKEPEVYSKPYEGWSSCYTMSSIHLQLYGFLLADDSIAQEHGSTKGRSVDTLNCMRSAESGFKTIATCSCGNNLLPGNLTLEAAEGLRRWAEQCKVDLAPLTPLPPPPALVDEETLQQRTPSDPHPTNTCAAPGGAPCSPLDTTTPATRYVELLDDNLWQHILCLLEPPALWRLVSLRGRLGQLALDCLQRLEQQCFFSKARADGSGTMVLGFGIQRQWHSGSGPLKGLSTAADYLSLEAFKAGVRRSAWNQPFDAFLPLYLNPAHGRAALELLPACVADMQQRGRTSGYAGGAGSSSAPRLSPQALLKVMAQLLNSLVVELAGAGKEGQRGSSGSRKRSREAEGGAPVSRSMSDAALQTFCHLHHLLLAAALQPGSQLMSEARREVQAFVSSSSARHKQRCPDLGVLLVQLLLVPKEAVPWSQLAPVLVRELLARQVMWAIRDVGDDFGRPHTERSSSRGDSRDDIWRLDNHFGAGAVGLRNVMLQAWFANGLARPATLAGCTQQLAAIKGSYDACSGMPPLHLFRAFNAQARSVLAAGGWHDFLRELRLGVCTTLQPAAALVALLRQAVLDSWAAGYHKRPALSRREEGQWFMDWERSRPLGVLDDCWVDEGLVA